MRNRSENQITLVFIRHGATKSNREHRYLGKIQESLTKEGRDALLKYKKEKRYPMMDYLFSSPMTRCVETAEILYPGQSFIVIPEWEEMYFGAFEGKNYLDLKDDERYQAWIDSNGTLPFPEGESRETFIQRCRAGFHHMEKQLEQQLEQLAQEKKMESLTIGIVVHGGTIMALLSEFGGGNYFDYQVANGDGYTCTYKKRNHAPQFINIRKL